MNKYNNMSLEYFCVDHNVIGFVFVISLMTKYDRVFFFIAGVLFTQCNKNFSSFMHTSKISYNLLQILHIHSQYVAYQPSLNYFDRFAV